MTDADGQSLWLKLRPLGGGVPPAGAEPLLGRIRASHSFASSLACSLADWWAHLLIRLNHTHARREPLGSPYHPLTNATPRMKHASSPPSVADKEMLSDSSS